MDLRAALNGPDNPDATRVREPQPEALYSGGKLSSISVSLTEVPQTEEAHRDMIRDQLGIEIPTDREVVLQSVRWWGPTGDDGKVINSYCRFDIKDRVHALEEKPDAVALLHELRGRKGRVRRPAFTGEGAFVVSWNDWQVGKKEGGGSVAIAERLDRAFDGVVERVKELKRIHRDLGELVIVGGGDLLEGCDMFQNHAFEVDMDRRAQYRATTAFILEGLDRIAPLFERVAVMAVGGNHGENRIGHKRTTRSDNDDCGVFESAAVACSRDDRLSQVRFIIADGEPAKTLGVGRWILGTTHGQVYGKSMAGSMEQKAFKWFQGQAAGRHPAGDSDVLLTHHFHHYATRDWGACQWVQTPAMDGGSAWVKDMNGQYSQPGMMTFTMTPTHRMTDMLIVE